MRNSGLAGLLGVLVGIIIIVVVLGGIFLAFYIPGYNRAIRLEQQANEAWANVDAQLQRRLDLIPNLVATVQGYAGQEKEIFTRIAEARTKYFQSDSIEDESKPPTSSAARSRGCCCSRRPTPSSSPTRTSAISRWPWKARRTASPWPARGTTRPSRH